MHIRAHKHLIQFLLKDAITTREKKNISFNPNLTVVLLGFCHKVLITLFSLHKYLSFFCVAALCRLANVLLLIFFLFQGLSKTIKSKYAFSWFGWSLFKSASLLNSLNFLFTCFPRHLPESSFYGKSKVYFRQTQCSLIFHFILGPIFSGSVNTTLAVITVWDQNSSKVRLDFFMFLFGLFLMLTKATFIWSRIQQKQ